MRPTVGRKLWAVAEGYIPPSSTGSATQFESHETLCILNAGERDAEIEILVYFADREPAGDGAAGPSPSTSGAM